MLSGLSTDEILHEILVAPRSAILPLDDTTVIERPGWWQVVTPSLKRGGKNEVACTELPEDTCDATIRETIDAYRRIDVSFRWVVAPGTKPADLGDRLARAGLQRANSLGVARATAGAPPDEDSAITVDEVGLADLDEYMRVMAEGWQMDPSPLAPLHRRILSDPARRHHLFLARHGGAAAAVATYVALERSVYLNGGVVLPAFRGRGVYRALVHARLRHAAARGIALATSIARAETSAPILARLGFETVAPLTFYLSG